MKPIIALAATTILTMGAGSAYAAGGNVQPGNQVTGSPGVTANASPNTASAATNSMDHPVSFMSMGGQFALPPGYKPHYDSAKHVVVLRYEHPMAATDQPAGHTVSFMSMGGQFALPPGYKPYYDHANHVVTLRYTGPVTESLSAGHTASFMSMGGQFALPPGYKPYYDHADHVVLLRYSHGVPTAANHG